MENPEQIEAPRNMELDLPFRMQTRQVDSTKPAKKNNPYGNNFLVESIDLKKVVEELVGLEDKEQRNSKTRNNEMNGSSIGPNLKWSLTMSSKRLTNKN